MAGGAIRAGKAFIELGLDKSKLDAGLANTQSKMVKWGQSVGAAFAASAAVVATATAAIAAAVNQFTSHGSALADMSNATGASASALSELEHAASQTGTEIKAVEKSLIKMNRTIGDAKLGTKQAKDALKQLGLTVEDLEGMSPDKQFELIADRIAEIEDPGLKSAVAMDIFGKSAAELFGLLNQGGEGIRRLREEAKDLRLGWSDEDVRIADELGDRMATFHALLQRTQEAAGSKFGSTLIEAFDKLNAALTFTIDHMEDIVALAKASMPVATALLNALPGAGAKPVAERFLTDEELRAKHSKDVEPLSDENLLWLGDTALAFKNVADLMKQQKGLAPTWNPFADLDARKNWLTAKAAVDDTSRGTVGSFNAFEMQQQAGGGANPIVQAIRDLKNADKDNHRELVAALKDALKGFGWGP